MATMTEITKYQCGHEEAKSYYFFSASDTDRIKHNNSSTICYDCRQAAIGQRVDVVRYGDLPVSGRSYNYRDGKYENGVSCYFAAAKPSPFIADGRKKIEFSAIVMGLGSDSEPVIDMGTVIYQ